MLRSYRPDARPREATSYLSIVNFSSSIRSHLSPLIQSLSLNSPSPLFLFTVHSPLYLLYLSALPSLSFLSPNLFYSAHHTTTVFLRPYLKTGQVCLTEAKRPHRRESAILSINDPKIVPTVLVRPISVPAKLQDAPPQLPYVVAGICI